MQSNFCCCPVCESYNRDFVCPNCVNSQSVQGQQLRECLAQAEQLRVQRAELLNRLQEQLAARVGLFSYLQHIWLHCIQGAGMGHPTRPCITLRTTVWPRSLNVQTCMPWTCTAGSLSKAAGCCMEEGAGVESSASQGSRSQGCTCTRCAWLPAVGSCRQGVCRAAAPSASHTLTAAIDGNSLLGVCLSHCGHAHASTCPLTTPPHPLSHCLRTPSPFVPQPSSSCTA